jgi:NAD(P)H-dependent flavin oxidoreductase YrpB (nitropropane dioxygenase family)
VKARYIGASVTDTVVTDAIDGAPQRVIRTEIVDKLEHANVVTRLPRALGAALRFRKETGTSLRDLTTEGLAMHKNQDLSWSQVALAANAPMLIKAAMVDGNPDVGVLPTGQVTGVIGELPTVAELLDRIMSDAASVLCRLGGPS